MVRFNLFGIPVTVEPWFWVTIAFLGGAMNISTTESLLLVLLFVMAGFISILIHEMGHALMIRKYRLPTQVTLTTFGGYASYPGNALNRKQSFLVTAAGPSLQIVFGLIVLFVFDRVTISSPFIAYFLYQLYRISIVWALLNCLPIYPLDGGQMLAAVLGPRRSKGLHMTGVICASLLAVWGFTSHQYFIAVFMGLFAWQNYQMLQHSR